MKSLALLTLSLLPLACVTSTHPTTRAELGVARPRAALLAVIDTPGPLEVETVTSADWSVPLSGMLDLDHPAAAHLEDRDEPISIYFHALRHPPAAPSSSTPGWSGRCATRPTRPSCADSSPAP